MGCMVSLTSDYRNRVLFTFDDDLLVEAAKRQREYRSFEMRDVLKKLTYLSFCIITIQGRC